MTTQCYAMVRGSAIRVTELDKRGWADGAGAPYAVSRSVAKVILNEVTDGGGNELVRSESSNEPRLIIRKKTQTIRYTVDIDFVRVDPGILSLVTGVPVVLNAAGEVAGFDRETRLPAKSFALEVWSRIAGQSCIADGGLTVDDIPGFGEGGFGTIPFGSSAPPAVLRTWGYSLFPWAKGGTLSGFVFANGAVSFNLRGAKLQKGAKYQGSIAMPEVSGNTLWRQFLTTEDPPTQTDGIIPTTVVEGGSASSTSADILDGEFADDTSDDITEGGTAA